jgi:hypothetical protein
MLSLLIIISVNLYFLVQVLRKHFKEDPEVTLYNWRPGDFDG